MSITIERKAHTRRILSMKSSRAPKKKEKNGAATGGGL